MLSNFLTPVVAKGIGFCVIFKPMTMTESAEKFKLLRGLGITLLQNCNIG